MAAEGGPGVASSPACPCLGSARVPDPATLLQLCAGHSLVGSKLSGSLGFWPRPGRHAFRKISPPPFTRGARPGRLCTYSSLNGHTDLGGSSGEAGESQRDPASTLGNRPGSASPYKLHADVSGRSEAMPLAEDWRQQTKPQSYTVSFKLTLPLAGRNQCTVY